MISVLSVNKKSLIPIIKKIAFGSVLVMLFKRRKSPQVVSPAMPLGMNGGYGSAVGMQTETAGIPPNCQSQQIENPSALLPSSHPNFMGGPGGEGELQNVNLLKAGQLAGIDTVGSTLRNANLQVRSEPANPRTQVSPWMNSTIEPDLMRVPLEIGCGSQ